MATSLHSFRTSRPLAFGAVVLGALLLSGCAPAGDPASTSSKTPAPSGTSTPSQAPSPTASADTIVSEPVGTTCDELLTLDDMYAFNPNISFAEDGKPQADSKAGQIAGMDGLTCQWVNNSSNETIDVGVARLPDDELTALKNLAVTESTQVPTYGTPPVEGYFALIGNQGEAQVFAGSYWLTLRSVAFFEPGDAEQLAEVAIAHLTE